MFSDQPGGSWNTSFSYALYPHIHLLLLCSLVSNAASEEVRSGTVQGHC